MRIGAKGRPFYRIVVVDERKKRTGSYLELLGTYNPLTTPKEIKLDQAKVDSWVKKGAQLSDGFLRITKQNTHIEPRKVKNPGKLRSNTPVKDEPVVSEQSSVGSNAVEESTSDVETAPIAEPADQGISESVNQEEAPTEDVAQDQDDEVIETTDAAESNAEVPAAEVAEDTSAEGAEEKG